MKKLICIVCAIMALWQVKAQETYLPVFGEGTTRFDVQYYENIDLNLVTYSIDCKKDPEKENVYLLEGGPMFLYSSFEVSEDNSKLWGIYENFQGIHKDLLMDLNLNIGDKFLHYTVSQVYYKDGRKHIELEGINRRGCLCTGADYLEMIYGEDYPYLFIEGVGPNSVMYIMYENAFVDWVYAQYRDGELVYGLDARGPFISSRRIPSHSPYPAMNEILPAKIHS